MGVKRLNKNKGRIRDTVKQVLLIDGTPSFLYKGRERTLVDIKVSGHTYKLGMLGTFVNELRDIPKFEIIERKITKYYPITIDLKGIGHRMTMRKVNGNTHITVGASDEKQLYERINLLKEYLRVNGVDVKERCHWVCAIDKKEEIKKENNVQPVLSEHQNNNLKKEELNTNPISTTTSSVGSKKELNEHTKSLREIAIRAVKNRKEAVIKMGLAAVYDK